MSERPVPQPARVSRPLTARRLRRKVWRGAVFACLGLLVAWVVLTRTPLTKRLVLPSLQRAVTVDLDAGSIVIAPDLRLILRDVTVRVPGLAGEAGELVRVGRIEIEPDWPAIARNRAGASRIELIDPLVRISQSAETGRLNVLDVGLPSASGGPLGRLPTLLVRGARVSYGEHDASGYRELASVRGGGSITPSGPADPGRYIVRFDAARGTAGAPGLSVVGRIDGSGVAATFSGLMIDTVDPALFPVTIRDTVRSLDIAGRASADRLTYDAGGEIELTLRVEGVALNVPTTESGLAEAPDAEPARPGAPLRLERVSGEIVVSTGGLRAEISGAADTIGYDVAVDVWGTSGQAAFLSRLRTRPFLLEDDLAVLRFAPGVVLERLDDFIDPRAQVVAEVWIARGAPPPGRRRVATARDAAPRTLLDRAAAEAGIVFLGRLDLAGGTTSFRDFPYPFERVAGSFVFESGSLRIENIRGVSPTGARLAVDGFVAPLGPEAEVDIAIRVDGVPLDQTLYAALGEHRKDAFDQLFDRERYAALLAEGLVLPSDEADALREQINALAREREAWVAAGGVQRAEIAALDSRTAALRERLSARPEFGFGGVANAIIRLHRQLGEVSVWSRSIDIDVPSAGLVPRHFPVPVLGRDMRLRLTRSELELHGGRYTTLAGGEIAISARAAAAPGEEGRLGSPTIEITGSGVPIDPLLLRAIPGPGTGAEGQPDQLAGILRAMRLRGLLACEARVYPAPSGALTYAIEVRVSDADARPGERLLLDGVEGVIVIDPDEVVLGADAVIGAAGGGVDPAPAVIFLSILLEPGEGPRRVYSDTRVPSLDLRAPVEDLVAVFAPELAQRIEGLRTEHEPTGHAHVQVGVVADTARGKAADPALDVVVLGGEDLAVKAGEERVTLTGLTGVATLGTAPTPRLRFDAFAGGLSIGGRPAGRLRLDGTLALGPPDRWPLLGSLPTLRAVVEEALFESALTRDIVERRLDDDAAALYTALDPAGVFDLEIWLEREAEAEANVNAEAAGDGPPLIDAGTLGRLRAYGAVRPRSLAVTIAGERLEIPSAGGIVRFEERGGVIEGLRAEAQTWQAEADGGWSVTDDGGFALDLRGGLRSERFPRDLLPLLPSAVRDVVRDLALDADGPVALHDASLRYERAGADAAPAFDVSTRLALEGATLSVGLPITEFRGEASLRAWSRADAAPGGATTGLLMDIDAERLRLTGIEMTDARARIVSGEDAGVVLIPEAYGDVHGGRMSASVRLGPGEGGPDAPQAYHARVRLSGVRLDGLLAGGADAVPLDDTPGPAGPGAERGLVDAELTLTGPVGSFAGARGRGAIRAYGGPIVDVPLLLSLVEFSNLQLPSASRVDFGEAAFYLRDDIMSFDSISVASGAVEFVGYGEMHLPSTSLDLRFTSTGHQRLPVLSDVVDTVRNEFIVTRITGTLDAPVTSADQFPATRRILGALMGRPDNPDVTRMLRLEREAENPQNRARRRLLVSPDTLIRPEPRPDTGAVSDASPPPLP